MFARGWNSFVRQEGCWTRQWQRKEMGGRRRGEIKGRGKDHEEVKKLFVLDRVS